MQTWLLILLTNLLGEAKSSRVDVSEVDLPDAPTMIFAEAINRSAIRIRWERPADINDITRYTIRYCPELKDTVSDISVVKFVTRLERPMRVIKKVHVRGSLCLIHFSRTGISSCKALVMIHKIQLTHLQFSLKIVILNSNCY